MGEKKKSKKVLIWIMYAFTAVLLSVIAYLVIMKLTNSVPQFFGYSAVKIVSPSMEPEIKTGEYIVIKKVSAETIVAGDVITFYSSDEAIKNQANTHRVAEVLNQEGKIAFVTKGDNNVLKDKAVVESDKLIGKLVKVSPALSFAGKVIGNQYVFLFVVVVPAGALLILEIINVMKKSKQIKRDELIEEEIERLREIDTQKEERE